MTLTMVTESAVSVLEVRARLSRYSEREGRRR